MLTPEEKRQRHRDYQRKWRASNPSSVKNSQKKYRESNYEKRAAYTREWRKEARKNPEFRKKNHERADRWRAANLTEYNLLKAARRAKMKGIKILKEDISNWESRICGICSKYIEDKFHIDHIIPLTRGGKHEVENLQLAHPSCNMSKYNKLPDELIVVS